MDRIRFRFYGLRRGANDVQEVAGDLDKVEVRVLHPSGLVLNLQPHEEGFDIYMTDKPSSVQVVQGTANYPVVRVITREAKG